MNLVFTGLLSYETDLLACWYLQNKKGISHKVDLPLKKTHPIPSSHLVLFTSETQQDLRK